MVQWIFIACVTSKRYWLSCSSCHESQHFLFFDADHHEVFVGIFMTTSVVPSGFDVVMSCGSWIWTGKVVLSLFRTWKKHRKTWRIFSKCSIFVTHVNGNFLWQCKMRNRSWHVIVAPMNTAGRANRRQLLLFNRRLVVRCWFMVTWVMRGLLFGTLC